jgi:D-alanine-D-alanine ligase-like ATP-grasp enzyme
MPDLDSIVFIDAPRGTLDRGWDHSGVNRVLRGAGVATSSVRVSTEADLRQAVLSQPRAVFWPLTYTFDGRPTGDTIVATLAEFAAPYLTCNPVGAALTSRLRFKRAVRESCLATPDWREVKGPSDVGNWKSYPVFVKSEFSCDSAGVRLAQSPESALALCNQLRHTFGHQLFLESAVSGREWSLACVVSGGRMLTAALSFRSLSAAYVDEAAKSNNTLIEFGTANESEAGTLSNYAQDIATRLSLSGYFRIDLLVGSHDGPEAIDLNILPCLEPDAARLSYLPMAFMQDARCRYVDVLGAIIASAALGSRALAPASPIRQLVESSSLLKSGEGCHV